MKYPRMTPSEAKAALATMTEADFPTVSLDEVCDEDGHPITEASLARLVDAAHELVAQRGRPSLTAPGTRSPQVTLRLSEPVKERLVQVAAAQHRRQSDVVRDALTQYLSTANA